ncbi:MAG TPA: hypothetical protein PL133_10190 [Methylophilaceae bacterium]|nr:hypothetical protein [Methylophilaceae bacterium]HQC29905.1 hypothetical protein [Methylotenera sp.]
MSNNFKTALVALLMLTSAGSADAWILNISSGPKQIYIQVGNGSYTGGNYNAGGTPANNNTVNVVSVNIPAASLGNGTPVPMTSNSSAANSFYDGFNVCNPPNQVYIGGWVRVPGSSGSGVMSVSTPASLVNSSGDTIPFSSISWTSTANGNSTPDISAGTFNGGTITLASIGANRWVENCMTFSYANTAVYAAGTYTGRAIYTLSLP